ncbi:aminotransferase-like domain-containing protein [Methylobacterium sp. WSM2598]|uniref:aminotransferase-like domain-containing protein n=1 Tax=Methylobacterium sp. WSM2598 TaxID=398261 RepID=UPI0009FEE990|nr:PLP-dependent aminotransferase family protein [Methylobacterium sp. WSM2598]
MALEKTKFCSWLPRELSLEGPRYLALVNALEQDVVENRLVDGSRLPPHRELAAQIGLSVGTVSKAYQEAEQRGIVSSHVGQGTFVRRRAPTVPVGAAAPQAVNMALNVPAHGREADVLSGLLSDVYRRQELAPLLDYHPHSGIGHHREVIARSISDDAFSVDPALLYLCNGAQHALDIAVRLVAQPGDKILVDRLTYSGFKAIAVANSLTLVPVDLDDEGTDPDALEAACRLSGARVYYSMPTLQSPTARTMSLQRRKRIAELAEKLDLLVIEDDVYSFFYPERPLPIAALIPERSFYVTSYSKCVAPGFRLGTLSVPPAFKVRAELFVHASSWFAAPILGDLAVRLLESGRLDELIRERRRQATERYRLFAKFFPYAEKLDNPPFYAWLPLPQEWSASRFTSAARGQGILVTPPTASTVDDDDPGAVRVCLGAPDDLSELSDALSILSEILARPPLSVFSVA